MAFQDLEVVHVVAMDQQRCIGKDNDLPWHISADLKHFKEITQGGVIVMGRKTLESMGRALPKRVNWVITRDPDWSFEGVKVAHTIEDALTQAVADVQASENRMLFLSLAAVKSLNRLWRSLIVWNSPMLN